jgi:hypothetical protein
MSRVELQWTVLVFFMLGIREPGIVGRLGEQGEREGKFILLDTIDGHERHAHGWALEHARVL